jgi:hypothetical protein
VSRQIVNWFEVLGVSENAGEAEIKQRRIDANRTYHPDRFTDERLKRENGKKLQRINAACDELLNESKREQLRRDLRQEREKAERERRERDEKLRAQARAEAIREERQRAASGQSPSVSAFPDGWALLLLGRPPGWNQRTYAAPPEQTWQALREVIAQTKRWSIREEDASAGVLTLNTGISMRTWSGQDVKVQVAAMPDGGSQVYVDADIARRGLASFQVVDWGEGDRVTKKLLAQLDWAIRPPA